MKLKKYQIKAVNKILDNQKYILQMPCGSGKTAVAIEVIKRLNLKGSEVLIISSVSGLASYQKVKIDTENLTCYSYDNFKTQNFTCGSVAKIKFVIIDECHNMRNYKKLRFKAIYRCLKNFKGRILLMSATLKNRFNVEFFAYLKVCEKLKDYENGSTKFKENYCILNDFFEPKRDINIKLFNANYVKDDVLLVISEEEVQAELNKKNTIDTQIHYLDLPPDVKMEIKKITKELDTKNYLEIVNKINTLLIPWKMGKLLKILEPNTIIFYNFTSELMVLNKLENSKIIGGSVTVAKRKEIVEQLNNKQINYVLINTRIGEGLDFNNTKNIIFFNFSPSFIKTKQAEDRIKRINNKNNLKIQFIICKDTAEEAVYKHLKDSRLSYKRFIENYYNNYK